MLTCGCRKKSQAAQGNGARLLFAEHKLAGTNAQYATFTAFLAANLPSGVVMPGSPASLGGMYTLIANTSNNPNPALPSVGTGSQQVSQAVTYNTPTAMWGSLAALFVTDNGEKNACDPSDINQGVLGDCWMLTAISLLAGYGYVGNPSVNVAQAEFNSVSPAGASNPSSVTVTLYGQSTAASAWGRSVGPAILQTVTTSIPVTTTMPNQPAFVKSDIPGEYWPCMLEKAVAAATTLSRGGVNYVGYPAVIGGMPSVGLSMFTPGIPAQYSFSAQPSGSQVYAAWNTCMSKGVAIACSWKSSTLGLVTGHAYGVFAIVSSQGYNLALIRNPWGVNASGQCTYNANSSGGEWTGAWSDCSPQWAANPTVATACGFTGPRTDGLFWMSFDDIAANLQTYEIFIPDSAAMRAVDLRKSPFTAPPSCTDVSGWKDRSGNTCSTFVGAGWCQGGVPLVATSSFNAYGSLDGNTALTACCGCGGGTTKYKACTDAANWKDLAGNTCTTFMNAGYCGGGQPLVATSTLSGFYNSSGTTPLTACCACGGGTKS